MLFASYATIALSLVGAAVALPPAKRGAGDVQNALNSLSSQISTLDAVLVAYPGNNMAPSELYNHFTATGSSADSVANAARGTGTLNEGDGQNVLNSLQNAIPQLEDLVQQLINKKIGFIGLPATGGIEAHLLQGLQSLTNSLTNSANSLLAIAPGDLQGAEQSLFQRMSRALSRAVSAFSS
ncbi:hypothetical protein BDN72DRAFT_375323 [Pluteus cervinus]|uniref:Uncharacterized protein n=1 Tax=Pluteus cervinus TaxID=181527 RepID=A0ACD3AAA8_9AGAR|nr:hypothetical protein BDN72DRAFT_375323 [Pluteus cervinus]